MCSLSNHSVFSINRKMDASSTQILPWLSVGTHKAGNVLPLACLARASISPARIHLDNRILLRQSFYCFNIRKTPNPENGAAYIARSVTFQHLMWRDSSWFVARPSPHYYATRWAVTRREFTLALAHKTCLLVRHNGSQHHLIMAIAHGTHAIARGTALHTFPSLKALPHMYHTGTHKYAQWS